MKDTELGLLVRQLYDFVIERRQAALIEQKQVRNGELWGRFDSVICAYRELQNYMETLFPWLKEL